MVYKIQLLEKKKGRIVKNEEYNIKELIGNAIYDYNYYASHIKLPPIWYQILFPKKTKKILMYALEHLLSKLQDDIYNNVVNYLVEKIKEDNFGKKRKR